MQPDTSSLDFQNLTDSKIDKFIKNNLKKILKRENEIREWIQKFFSDKWYNEELERIKEFESLADNIEGFQDDIEIKKSYEVIGINGKITEYIEESPDVDKSKIQKSIQNMVPKYSEKAKKLLDTAKVDLENFNLSGLKKKKQILQVISEKFSSYWTYLGYLRTAYVDIFNIIRLFDYSLTIKFLMRTVLMVLYDIDEQKWYRDRIFGHKKVLKLLDGNL